MIVVEVIGVPPKPKCRGADYVYVTDNEIRVTNGQRDFVVVEEGAKTNFATLFYSDWWGVEFIKSVFPELTQYFNPYHHSHDLAATVHDACVGEFGQKKALLYREGQEPRELSWSESAEWFYAIMKYEGSPWLKRKAFYSAVILWKRIKKIQREINDIR